MSTQENPKAKDRIFDKILHTWNSQFYGWLSPPNAFVAVSDWLSHLAVSPQQRWGIVENMFSKLLQFTAYQNQYLINNKCEPCISCKQDDRRFQNELWHAYPFNFYAQGFLLCEQLWNESTTNLWGSTKHHQYIINFSGRQLLDLFAPSNYILTNPEVLQVTYQQNGENLVRGFNNLLDDISRATCKLPPAAAEKFKVGETVALSKGQVVYRNRLIELIQYSPTTQDVYAEPILIVPAWIMKYYILDLSPHNSMVKYLIEQGHTVFMISWKNPESEDRDLSLENYLDLGIFEALTAINSIIPNQKVHAVGYCIGGTLLSIAAAIMAGKADHRLKTMTLFAAQVDFKDAGELLLFVDEGQISYLEDIMATKGYLDGTQMGGAFSMLRSVDLIWSRMIKTYLMGEPETMNDLMAWDQDTTRLPAKMHSEYLRNLFLNNDLVEGRFTYKNTKVSLLDIEIPIFVVSTVTDHVAPWTSVFKIHFFVETDITFVLTSGGHNAGIVSEPGHPNRSFQMQLHKKSDKHKTMEVWQNNAPKFEGSWWPQWNEWLINAGPEKSKLPTIGNPNKGYDSICPAPGTYVFG